MFVWTLSDIIPILVLALLSFVWLFFTLWDKYDKWKFDKKSKN